MDEHWVTQRVISGHTDANAGLAIDELLGREWLLTNGTGAFCAGTAANCNTRRYHGLLIAATSPPVGRVLALNQVFERLQPLKTDGSPSGGGGGGSGGGDAVHFTTCMFRTGAGQDIFEPHGHHLLQTVQRGLSVKWTYAQGPLRMTRELHLHWKQQAITLVYDVTLPADAPACLLQLSPMLTLRDFHGIVRRDGTQAITTHRRDDRATFHHGDLAVTMRCQGAGLSRPAQFVEAPDWWFNVFYRIDDERGQENREDYHVPGAFEVTVQPGGTTRVTLTAALGSEPAEPVVNDDARAAHLTPMLTAITGKGNGKSGEKHANPQASPGAKGDTDDERMYRRALVIAADDFVVDRRIRGRELSTIIAGYPWFADWGRDTFIALEGLLLCTGRLTEARKVLEAFAEAIRNGLVPNRFDDYDDRAAHYNTVDASLWFVHAAMQYLEASGDLDAWRSFLRNACTSIIEGYLQGTDHDIRAGGDGLISAGSPGTQLTWMDAACDGVIFTPRHGKAIEINALWYHALAGLGDLLADPEPDLARHYEKLGQRVKRAFVKVFWNEHAKCLYDTVWTDPDNHDHPDPTIRPNQIFIVALPNSPLPVTKQKQVLAVVQRELLTPFGLRTLPESDPNYHARYHGPQRQRDEAYHQGTIWPWLIGPYAEAVLRVGKFSPKAIEEATAALAPLRDHLMGEGFGQLSEIHEAKPPHRPVGCFAQAWSIAELLRVQRLIDMA
jgi:glycogen debranching enzyme